MLKWSKGFAVAALFVLLVVVGNEQKLCAQVDSAGAELLGEGLARVDSGQVLSSYETTDSLANFLDRLIEEERYAEAIAAAGRAEVMDARGFYYCGLAHFYLNQDELAVKQFDQSLELQPDAPGPHYYKATISLFNGAFGQAVDLLDVGLKRRPNDGDLMALKGRAYSLMQQPDSAINYWEQSLKLAKFPSTVYNDLGNAYFDKQLNIKAREMYQQSMAYLPEGSATWMESAYNMGIIDYRRGDYQSAEELYRKIIKQAPADFGAMEKLIQVYYAKSEFSRADSLKSIIKGAYLAGELGDFEQGYSFRIDRFKWKGYNVFVHERLFSENGLKEWEFYLADPKGQVVEKVKTDLNPSAISTEELYLMVDEANGMNFSFQENFDYEKLKAAAMKILAERIKH